ncbi:MAG: arsenate reductase ArsC [Deltaproteobacteria bacterium]|jgi:arsenate reductase|nr:arsenate reductase ArsC [Deltaproteobacteria bacterium]
MPQAQKTYDVLFLCTGNSARSILAEAILTEIGGERFRAHSAGSHPRSSVHPMALEILRDRGRDPTVLRSKSWDEFARPDAPALDFVFTVCDDAASETCPVWAGQPITAHWGIPDPAAAPPERQRAAFTQTWIELERRIDLLTSLRVEELERLALKHRLEEIGRSQPNEPTR